MIPRGGTSSIGCTAKQRACYINPGSVPLAITRLRHGDGLAKPAAIHISPTSCSIRLLVVHKTPTMTDLCKKHYASNATRVIPNKIVSHRICSPTNNF